MVRRRLAVWHFFQKLTIDVVGGGEIELVSRGQELVVGRLNSRRVPVTVFDTADGAANH